MRIASNRLTEADVKKLEDCMRAPLCIWIGCILVCSLFLNARAETELAGTISANSTLTSAQSPYTLTGTLYVSDNATLTIQSGVEIDMNGNDIWFGL